MKTILLVEDEAVIALNEANTLERHGFRVIIAYRGREVPERLREEPAIALILLDIDLGDGTDTTELVSEIEKERELPIIILTNHADKKIVDKVKDITRYGYVLKTSGEFVLIESIRKALELFNAHKETKRSERQYKDLAAHLQMLREEENAHIARELHDGLGQDLSLLRLSLSRLVKEGKVSEEDVKPLIERVGGVIDSVRSIVTNLRPFPLDEFGLQSAVEARLEELEESTGIACSADLPPGEIHAFPRALQGVYKIFQEAIANVARHAVATEIKVFLRVEEGFLVLHVIDNGDGIREDDLEGVQAFGILGMYERAELLGARLTIAGNPGKGTEVFLKVPLAKTKDEAGGWVK